MTERSTPTQQILAQVTQLSKDVSIHITEGISTNEKVAAMYEIIVTGNGELPLTEIVRGHGKWIDERCRELVIQKQDIKDDKKEARAFRRSIWLIGIGQLLTFLLLGGAVILGWK